MFLLLDSRQWWHGGRMCPESI